MTYPPTWTIDSVIQGQHLFKYKKCFLTQVNVDYSPNSIVSSFADGKPVQINVNLTFKEGELVTASDFTGITSGYGY